MDYLRIAIDFDGTIAEYHNWMGKCNFGEPLPGAKEAICGLKSKGHTIIINTTRQEVWAIKDYLDKHEIPFDYVNYNPDNYVLDLSPTKIIADVYIDDRNIEFKGDWSKAVEKVNSFKVWWKKNREEKRLNVV